MNHIQTVEHILSEYKNFIADYEQALLEILKFSKQKKLNENGKIESDIEIIAGMSLSTPILSSIPKSITNKYSSITENVALNYLQFLEPSSLEIAEIEKKISEQKKILTYSFERINLIEQMFLQLNEQEKFIIENIYINCYSLNKTLSMFNKEYPDFSIETYRAIRIRKFKALKKMTKRIKAP